MKQIGLALVLAGGLLFWSAPACAQEKTADQRTSGIAEVSVFWKWANFAILFGVLGFLANKQISPLLIRRSADIQQGLAAGEMAKSEAEDKAREVDARLGNLDGAINQIRIQAKADREMEAGRLQKELQLEIARIQHHAEMEIDSAAKQAAVEVRRYAASLALELAQQKLLTQMTPDTQSALFNNFVKKVATANHRRAGVE